MLALCVVGSLSMLFAFSPRFPLQGKRRFDLAALGSETNPTFVDLCGSELPSWLSSRCEKLGFTTPTIAQEMSLPSIFDGNDVILQSHTGSGKTLAYSLPVLSSVDASRSAIQAVIVVPTRELGQQVTAVLKQLSQGSPEKIMIMTVVEGSKNRRQQLWAVAEPPHIVVGNPRSLQRLVDTGRLRLNSVNFVVLDEVDACLISSETRRELHTLLSQKLSNTYQTIESVLGDTQAGDLQENLVYKNRAKEDRELQARRDSYRASRQTILCSATIPQRQHFAEMCMSNGWTEQVPEIIHVSAAALVPEQVVHEYIPVDDDVQRVSALRYVVAKEAKESGASTKMIIFADKEDMESEGSGKLQKAIKSALVKSGVDLGTDDVVVGALQETLSLDERASILASFRDGKCSVLLCTPGMASRGIDVPDTSHVIMLNLPATHDEYVHQAGRTGRFGRVGKVVVFTKKSQDFVVERFSNEIGIDIVKRQLKSKKKD